MSSKPRTPGSLVLVATLLLWLAGRAEGNAGCIDILDHVSPGGSVTVQATEPSWIQLEVRFDRVYRLEASGTPGAVLELWRLDFDEAQQCYVADALQRSVPVDAAPGVVDLTGWFHNALRLVPAGGVWEASLHLEELAAPPEAEVVVIPAVAHTRGVGGTLFESDVVILNPAGLPVTANLVLVPGGSVPKQVVPVEIGAGQTLALDDVVGTLFGLDDAVGALRIETTMTSLFTVSRTYATSDAGSYGQAVPALSWDAAAGGNNGAVRTLLHLASSAAFRSNVGFVEVLGLDAELDLEMHDPTGAVLGRRTLTLPASSHLQVNDIFAFLGAPDTDCASLRVEILNQARVFTYASVVENRSSDPLFVPGMNPEPGPLWALDAGRTLLVPAAAATDGLHGTRWLTDLRVQELEAAPAVDITFIPADGSAPRSGSFDFAGSGPLAIDDVVTRLGGIGNGHLLLTSAGGRIVATSRTYTAGSDGTYGQFIGALLFGSLEHGVVLGLEGSLDFRSNLGIVNDQESPTAVELRLVSAAGEVLGRRTITVPPQRRRQITDVFGFFGVPGGEACWLEFRTVQGPGPERRLYVHGSVVDNRSGDPSTVPAVMCFAPCGPPWATTSR